jgi:hypothetical protein
VGLVIGLVLDLLMLLNRVILHGKCPVLETIIWWGGGFGNLVRNLDLPGEEAIFTLAEHITTGSDAYDGSHNVSDVFLVWYGVHLLTGVTLLPESHYATASLQIKLISSMYMLLVSRVVQAMGIQWSAQGWGPIVASALSKFLSVLSAFYITWIVFAAPTSNTTGNNLSRPQRFKQFLNVMTESGYRNYLEGGGQHVRDHKLMSVLGAWWQFNAGENIMFMSETDPLVPLSYEVVKNLMIDLGKAWKCEVADTSELWERMSFLGSPHWNVSANESLLSAIRAQWTRISKRRSMRQAPR